MAHHMFNIETCQRILQHKIHQDQCHECTILGRKVTSSGVAMRHGLVGWFRSDKVSQRSKLEDKNYSSTCNRVVGFDELGGTDSFSTGMLELKLTNAGGYRYVFNNIGVWHDTKLYYQASSAKRTKIPNKRNVLYSKTRAAVTMTIVILIRGPSYSE